MKKIVFILLLGIGLTAASPVYAAVYRFSAQADNRIAVGDVSISIQEFERDETGNLIPYKDGKTVLPNERLSKIVRIINEAEPAWIRARAEFIAGNGIEDADDSMLGGISDSWIRRGEYYYYTKPVETDETISFFKEVLIPENWDERCAEKEFSIDVTAQAVQKIHFEPAFESDDPWFGLPIEKCVHSDYEVCRVGKNMAFSVIFENGTEGLVKTGEDFFENFSALMPGDTETDSFILGNRYPAKLPITFRTEIPDDQSTESRKLLEDMELTIRRKDEVIYKGPLSAERLKDGVLLAVLQKDATEAITYQLCMPDQLGNASARSRAQVRWIFSTEYTVSEERGEKEEEDKSRDEDREDGMPSSETELPVDIISEAVSEKADGMPETESRGNPFFVTLPETGDRNPGLGGSIMTMLACGGAGSILALFSRRRKEEAGEENSDEE